MLVLVASPFLMAALLLFVRFLVDCKGIHILQPLLYPLKSQWLGVLSHSDMGQAFANYYIPGLGDFVVVFLLSAVLLTRPQGLLGKVGR